MSARWTQLSAILLVLATAVACTDGRPSREQVQLFTNIVPPATTLVAAADVKFGGKNTDSLQMTIKGNSLFLTGRPFGFSRWEIGSAPESPSLTFAASDQIEAFSPMGKWVVDWYTSGALAIVGQIAFTSGTVGTSVINMTETTKPREVQRYPALDPNSDQVPSDEAFVYAAMVPHPTKPLLYGFRRQDYVYTVDLSQGKMNLQAKDAYGEPGESVCCVLGATAFQNKVYVAFRDRLVFFDIGSDGRLTNAKESLELAAVNVQATPRYLYVQHEPSSAGTSQRPSGIYVFDANGENVAFFKAGNPRRFAVSPDDSHFYSNADGQSVKIFRIQWTN